MDYDHAFGAELRQVGDRTRDGQAVRAVVATRVYATDRGDLWNALTDAERLARWFAPVAGELEPGGRFQIEGNAEGSILTCDPPDQLEVTWEFGGQVSWVRVALAEKAGGTEMTLEHLMPKDEAAEKHWNQYGPGATGVGWDLSFLGLDLYLASGGEALDREWETEWATSDPGKAFLRDSAQRWGTAHVEAGEDPEVAGAMTQRICDFYTDDSDTGDSDTGDSDSDSNTGDPNTGDTDTGT